jgi:hypothetical protein
MRSARDVILDGKPASAVALPILILVTFTVVFVLIAIRRLDFADAKVGWT